MRIHRLILDEQVRRAGLPGLAGALMLAAAFSLALGGLVPTLDERDRVAGALADAEAGSGPERAPDPARQATRILTSLPLQDEATGALEGVFAAAGAEGLAVGQGEYVLSVDASGALARYQIRVPLRGSYPQIRRFVAHALEAQPTLGLEQIEFQRQSIAEREVDATVGLTLFLARSK